MKTVLDILEECISTAMAKISGCPDSPAIVVPATDAKFGDYQVNGVMALAKKLKGNPRQLAQKVVEGLRSNSEITAICESIEIAGPGFINIRLRVDFAAKRLLAINEEKERLGITKETSPKTIVVDFSCPNIAKQMHVGHLRSTIIGDCICRLLEFEGHKVIRQNHIGDWGTQFGKILYEVQKLSAEQRGALVTFDLEKLEKYYQNANKLEQENPEAAKEMRLWTVKLQQGDAIAKSFWKMACEVTLKESYELYQRLNVTLKSEHTRGESFYNDQLPDVVDELKKKGLAVESQGAVCVFPEGFKDKDGKPLPFIIQKSDGAYLYATTDLAALRYRVSELKADKIIYVTDARQKLHFEMLFAVARLAGWTKRDDHKIELVHVTFGSVLGENGRPLKTREGENVKLKDLLDEAIERAKAIVEEKNPDLPPQEKEKIANAVGIGAVKYADFTNSRTSDYVFSFNKMLAMEGNTAPYMQYAYARIKSIGRKAQEKGVDIERELGGIKTLNLTEPAELDLAKYLVRYCEAIETALSDYRPNYLTSYLYELAQKFSVFYTNCPVLDAPPDKRPTRLLLCDLTARTIQHGLSELLGIEVVEQM
jgi:arginyl-tRNA synthetase